MTNGIVISKSITLDCAGYNINGNGIAKGFTVTGNNVILKNVNIINTKSSNYAAAIYWSGDNGVLMNTNIDDCELLLAGYAYSAGISWWGNNGTL